MAGQITTKREPRPGGPGVPYGYKSVEEATIDLLEHDLSPYIQGSVKRRAAAQKRYDEMTGKAPPNPQADRVTGTLQDVYDAYGWTEEQLEAAQAAYEARQAALALDANRDSEIAAARDAVLRNRDMQAGLLGELSERAKMQGTSAAQWSTQAGFNELANEVAAHALSDPRAAMRALGTGGVTLGGRSAVAQAQEGLGRQGALLGQIGQVRSVDLGRATAEQQLIADAIRWQNAKEMAAQRWADIALKSRGVDYGIEGAAHAGAHEGQSGIDWRNLASGILGATGSVAAGLSNIYTQPQPPGFQSLQNDVAKVGLGWK